MSETFDPYHKWLGISPQNQPPDLYRLLALELFEADPEVIEAAANRQMAYVRSCSTGPYVGHSQKLLNEIAAARLCLLDSPRKAKYDAALRTKHSAGRGPAPPIAGPNKAGNNATARNTATAGRPAPPAAPVGIDPANFGSLPFPPAPPAMRVRRSGAASRRHSNPLVFVALLAGLGVVVTALILYMLYKPAEPGGTVASSLKRATPEANRPGAGAMTEQQKREAAAPIGAPGSALASEANATTTGGHAGGNDQVPPRPVASSSDHEALYRNAKDELRKPNPQAASEDLEHYLADPAAANKPAAAKLIEQIKLANSDDVALAVLAGMTDEQFAAFEQGRLVADFNRLDPDVVPTARETLQRNLAEAKHRRAPRPAPAAAGGPATPPAGPLAAVASAPMAAAAPAADPGLDPLAVLKSKGLERAWSTWVLVDEKQLAGLLEKASSVDDSRRSNEQNIRRSTRRLDSARHQLDRDEAALKRAEAQDDAGASPDGHKRLRDKIDRDREAVEQVDAELKQLNDQPKDDSGDAKAAMADAQKLVAKIDADYRRLSDDAQVASALAKLGQRLGPSDQFKRLREKLGRLPARKPAS